jgi:MFS family permease
MTVGVSDDPSQSPTARVLTATTFHVILASSFVGVIGIPLLSPALPAIRSAFGVSDVQIGLLTTVYTLPIIVGAPVIGAYADRIGRKPILVGALTGYGVLGAASAFAPVYPVLLALRFLQGAAASGLITLSLILIADHFDGAERNAAMGINGAVISVGAAVAPALGGLLTELAWNASFFVYAAGLPVAVYTVVALEPTDVEAPAPGPAYVKNLLSSVWTPEAVTLYGTVFAMFAILFGAIYTLVPLMLDSDFGLTTGVIGLVITASPAVSAVVASANGFLARYLSSTDLVVVGMVLLAASMLGLGLTGDPILVAGFVIVVFGAAKGIGQPAFDTALSNVTPPEFRGSAMSLRTSIKNIGGAAGPVALTSASASLAYGTLFAAVGVVTLLFTVVAAVVLRTSS